MTVQKILIVDDEPFNVDYLEQELDGSGCEIITASNGQEALDQVHAGSPDLILLDIMMPVMDGFQVLAHLKADAATRDIPVIVISASNSLDSVVRGIQLGAEDYLPKPFEPTLLHARISSSLEKKRLRDLQHLYLKNLEREFDIAREIQQDFLPSELPRVDGWEIGVYFKAAREVAGDFYDAFLLPDGNLAVVIGDVCGKGVGAALYMTLFRSLIRVTSTTNDLLGGDGVKTISPGERLQHAIVFTNNYIAETHSDANMFATVFIGIVNLQDSMLTYINCGNEPPLLVRSGKVLTLLPPTGPAVGIIPDAKFTVKEMQFKAGDLLVAFTDGIPDALDKDGTNFGNDRLQNLLNGAESTAAGLLKNIEEQVQQFIGSAEQFDDITLLEVKKER
jgi:phosphoserine phosphatase RsbU/P